MANQPLLRTTEFGEITQNTPSLRHSRSFKVPILVPIESAYATSY